MSKFDLGEYLAGLGLKATHPTDLARQFIDMRLSDTPPTFQATFNNVSPINRSSMDCFADIVRAWELGGFVELTEDQVFNLLRQNPD